MKKPPFLPPTDYEVGYRKPPSETRFQPGQSGNQKGRPLGALNKVDQRPIRLFGIIRRHAERMLTANEGGKEVTMPLIEVVTHRIAADAVRGHLGSARLFLKMFAECDRHDREYTENYKRTLIEFKASWMDVPRPPDLTPNPDHIVFCPHTDQIQVLGPLTPEQKKEQRQWQDALVRFEEKLELIKVELQNKRYGKTRRGKLLTEFHNLKELVELLKHQLRPDRDWLTEPSILKILS